MKNTASSLLFEVLTVVTYCSSNLPWGQNILLTWRLLPIKRLVKCRADIEGNTSPAFKGQFFLEVSRRFRIVHQMVPSMDTSISERHVFFWMKNFQSCFGNEMGPPQKTTTRYAQWSLNNISSTFGETSMVFMHMTLGKNTSKMRWSLVDSTRSNFIESVIRS